MNDKMDKELSDSPGVPDEPLRWSSNRIGLAGFVLSLAVHVVPFGWIFPWLSYLVFIVALALCAIGVRKKPRHLAMAGLIVSTLSVLALLAILVFVSLLKH